MSVWLCPACQERLDRDASLRFTFDLRDPDAEPLRGVCWGCGTLRLRLVDDQDDGPEPR